MMNISAWITWMAIAAVYFVLFVAIYKGHKAGHRQFWSESVDWSTSNEQAETRLAEWVWRQNRKHDAEIERIKAELNTLKGART